MCLNVMETHLLFMATKRVLVFFSIGPSHCHMHQWHIALSNECPDILCLLQRKTEGHNKVLLSDFTFSKFLFCLNFTSDFFKILI